MQTRTDAYLSMNPLSGARGGFGPAVATSAPHHERLPFRVKLVRDGDELDRAVSIRHAAYARHVPAFAATLTRPESFDYEGDTAILLAESKLDGSPIGTMRIKTNRTGALGLEQSVELPEWLQDTTIAEATRLGIAGGRAGMMAKTVLFKAFYQYCLATGVDWMVITARAPLDRQYEDLLFQDVYPGGGFIPMRHIGGIPHRVLALDVPNARARWAAAGHPLLGFMCDTVHADIDLAGARDTAFRLPATRMVEAPALLM
jgi:hypothetical protein